MASPKEPQFFSRDATYQRGLGWYAQLFADARPGQVLGEASTCYSRHAKYPLAATRLHQHLPHARLVYLLRHPVERLYSHYVFSMQCLGKVMTFEEFLKQDDEAVDASNFIAQIEHYTRLFNESSLQCVFHEDLFGDSSENLRQLLVFLGLEDGHLGDLAQVRENVQGSLMRKRTVKRALSKIRNSPPVKQVVDVCPKWIRPSLRRLARDVLLSLPYSRRAVRQLTDSLSPLSAAERRSLCLHYRPSVRQLEEFTGRQLPHWLE